MKVESLTLKDIAIISLPIILLFSVIGGFVLINPLDTVESGQPLPDLSITYTEIPNSEIIIVHVFNNGPEPVTVSQVLVDDAYWNYRIQGDGGDKTIAPLQSASIILPYHTTPGFDYDITLLTLDGVTFHHTIIAAQQSPSFSFNLLWMFVIIGLFVGFIPVLLGMLWFPSMQRMSNKTLHVILSFSAGILAFLVFDAGFEAFELTEQIPGVLEGPILVVLSILCSLILLQIVMNKAKGNHPSSLVIAYGMAIGIGLHNLAEGLAIGSSIALGRVSLGAFLVVGFMIHNVTEGPAIVAPLAGENRPSLSHFVILGSIAGLPTILGGWIGGLAFSPILGVLFLAIGVGALLQVIFDIGEIITHKDKLFSSTNIVGFAIGFTVMYLTDLLVII